MFLRIAVVAPLALAAVLPAQLKPVPSPILQGKPVAVAPVKELTPAEQAAKLTKEKALLEKEIKYATQRVLDAKQLLAVKMSRKKPNFRSIDAGKPASAKPLAPKRVQRKFARIGSKEEMDYGGQTVMIKVNDRAISQASYDGVMNYLRESAIGGNEALLAQRVLYDMIRIEAIASQFIENEGEVKLSENQEKIASGKMPLKQAAREFGSVQGATNGMVIVTRNSIHGPYFEHIAFSTPAGKISRPFRTMNGYAMLMVKEFEKGAKPQLDKVTAHVVQFAYTADPQTMSTAHSQVNLGQTTVLVRDQEVLKLMPALFKRPAPRTTPRQLLTKQMSDLMREYKLALQSNPKKAAALNVQIEAIRAKLTEMVRATLDAQSTSDATDNDAIKKAKVVPVKKAKVVPVKKKKGGK